MSELRHILLAVLAAMIFVGTVSAVSPEDVENALDRLDKVLLHKGGYEAARQHYIDSLRSVATERGDEPGLLMDIGEAYTSFNNDSALVCFERGMETATGADRLAFMWKRASLLPLSGFFDEAQLLYESIPVDSVPEAELASYYDAGRQMHSYIAAFFKDYPEVSEPNRQQALELQSRLLEILPDSTDLYKFQLGEYYFLTDRIKMARLLLEEILDNEPLNSTLRARAAHHLSSIALEEGDENAYHYYLAQSAIADCMTATREVISLQELGAGIYAAGDVSRAHHYLSSALEDAVECGAPLRMVESSKSLPIIERAHSAQVGAWRRTIYWIIAAMGLLLVVLVVMMLVLRHEMHKMSLLQDNLRAANKTKEVYISQFLELCSIYMDKLNSFCKIATRKLAAGQSDELYRMTKSGKFVEEQSREFYEVFDNAFLHIYPDFVSKVNALLKPDEQIELKQGELLNTDLRILAFMRLGIEESSRIAQVLNYSLNTIYAYRNRLKSRALDRENFENQIRNITSGD